MLMRVRAESFLTGPDGTVLLPASFWLRLERRGDLETAYYEHFSCD